MSNSQVFLIPTENSSGFQRLFYGLFGHHTESASRLHANCTWHPRDWGNLQNIFYEQQGRLLPRNQQDRRNLVPVASQAQPTCLISSEKPLDQDLLAIPESSSVANILSPGLFASMVILWRLHLCCCGGFCVQVRTPATMRRGFIVFAVTTCALGCNRLNT